MTGLTFILEVRRVQADLWIVAVLIVQPDLMVNDQARLIMTDLTQSAIYSQPTIYISLPSQAPGPGLVELFLVHVHPPLKHGPASGAGLTALCYLEDMIACLGRRH